MKAVKIAVENLSGEFRTAQRALHASPQPTAGVREGSMMRGPTVAAVVLMAIACRSPAPPLDTTWTHLKERVSKTVETEGSCSTQEDAIVMALLRYPLEQVTGMPPMATRYFLRIHGQDPKPELLAALGAPGFRLYPGSNFTEDKACLLDIQSVTLAQPGKALVEASTSPGCIGFGIEWRLTCRKNLWTLDPDGVWYHVE